MLLIEKGYQHLKSSVLLLGIFSILTSCGTLKPLSKTLSDRELIQYITFSGEGRAIVQLAGEKSQSLSFESLLKEKQWLIEFSKALYGQELLTVNFAHQTLSGELIEKNISRFSSQQIFLMSHFARDLSQLLPILKRSKKNCRDIECLSHSLKGWRVWRENNSIYFQRDGQEYFFSLALSIKTEGIHSTEFTISSLSQKMVLNLYFKP